MHLLGVRLHLSVLILKLLVGVIKLVHQKLGLIARGALVVISLRAFEAVLGLLLEELCLLSKLLDQVVFLQYLPFELLELCLIIGLSLHPIGGGCRSEAGNLDQIVPLQ